MRKRRPFDRQVTVHTDSDPQLLPDPIRTAHRFLHSICEDMSAPSPAASSVADEYIADVQAM